MGVSKVCISGCFYVGKVCGILGKFPLKNQFNVGGTSGYSGSS